MGPSDTFECKPPIKPTKLLPALVTLLPGADLWMIKELHLGLQKRERQRTGFVSRRFTRMNADRNPNQNRERLPAICQSLNLASITPSHALPYFKVN